MGTHDIYTRHILGEIERGRQPTQRALSAELGIALGLTNLLIRRIVKKGWVKAVNVTPKRARYLITPTGIAEKARITGAYFDNTIRLYTETRERIRESLAALSSEWPSEHLAEDGSKRIVFYGAGEVAEIAFIGLQRTDLRLVGVVDDGPRDEFFGLPVHSSAMLRANEVAGQRFGRLVVMSLRRADQIGERLEGLGVPRERVSWL